MYTLIKFLTSINDPKKLKEFTMNELKKIVKNINYKMMKKLDDETYRNVIKEDKDIFKKFSKLDDKGSMLECIKFKNLAYNEIIEFLENLINNNDELDDNLCYKLIKRLLSSIDEKTMKKIMLKKDKLEGFLNTNVIERLENIDRYIDGYENFIRNLNILLDQYND